MPEHDLDLIWIHEAEEDYHRSRKWLDSQVSAGHLTLLTMAGDKRFYLRRSQLDALLRPREVRATVRDAG